jgi:hypothetical protein
MTLKDLSGYSLPGTANQPASGLTTPDIVPVEKDQHDCSDLEIRAEQIETSSVNGEEYPTGSRLIFILVSLILSVFLVALDMVSCYSIWTSARY